MSIKLNDGTVITCELNGNTYIADLTDHAMFSDENLSKVEIGGTEYTDMHCSNIWDEDNKTKFIIRELYDSEKKAAALDEAIMEMSELLAAVLG